MMVDFRKQLDELIVLVIETRDNDPSSSDLFIFRYRSNNKLKCIYSDGICFWAKSQKKMHAFPDKQ